MVLTEATRRAVRKCLPTPTWVVSVEAWWGVKSSCQAVVTRHHVLSTPTPTLSPRLEAEWGTWTFNFLRPRLWYMEVPKLGVKLELKLPAYVTATATAT